MPTGTAFNDIIDGKHELRGSRIYQEDGSTIKDVQTELFFSFSKDDKFDDQVNLTGTVTIERNKAILGKTYDVVGEINATYNNNTKVNGYFWAESVEGNQ